MKGVKGVLMNLGILYGIAIIFSDPIQENSRRAIETSRFGILFRKASSSPRTEVYNNKAIEYLSTEIRFTEQRTPFK